MNWENVWHSIGILAAITVLAIVTTITFKPKNVDYYYLSDSAATATATCVYAHWTWHTDEKAFCTDDYIRALDFVNKANASRK